MLTLLTILANEIKCTEVVAEMPDKNNVLMTVYKRQIAYHTNKITELEKKLNVFPFSILALENLNKPVVDFEKTIEWAERDIEEKITVFINKYTGVKQNNPEWKEAYSDLIVTVKGWVNIIEKEKIVIKWIEETESKKRKQIEKDFALLKEQEEKHWDERYEIEQKLRTLEEKINDENI